MKLLLDTHLLLWAAEGIERVIDTLPPIHKDPFDRMLIAQAMVEGITLLTEDTALAQYQAAIRLA